jgi:hypothetical protein
MSQQEDTTTIPTSRKSASIKKLSIAQEVDLEAQSIRSVTSGISKGKSPDDASQSIKSIQPKSVKEESVWTPPPTPPESIWKKITRVRFIWWWFLGSILFVIPLILFAVVFTDTRIHGVRVRELLSWIEVSWTAFWVSYFLAWAVGRTWYALMQQSRLDADDYEDYLNDLRLPITFMLWSVISWSTTFQPLCGPNDCDPLPHWIYILRRIVLATIVVASIFLLKGLALEFVVARTGASYLNPRKKELQLSVDACTALLYDPTDESLKDPTWIRKMATKCIDMMKQVYENPMRIFLHRASRNDEAAEIVKQWSKKLVGLIPYVETDGKYFEKTAWVCEHAGIDLAEGRGNDWM